MLARESRPSAPSSPSLRHSADRPARAAPGRRACSSGNIGALFGLAAMATTTRSKMLAARRTRSWWPLVIGSNVPGYTALRFMWQRLPARLVRRDDTRPRRRACAVASCQPGGKAGGFARAARSTYTSARGASQPRSSRSRAAAGNRSAAKGGSRKTMSNGLLRGLRQESQRYRPVRPGLLARPTPSGVPAARAPRPRPAR